MQQPNLRQGTAEWHEFRQKHIGGSDAAICLGESQYMTPYQLYLEKIGLGKPRQINSAMQNGIDLEEPARRAFEQSIGVSVFPVVRKSRTIDFMIASMDGLDMDEKIAVEIKCPMNMIYHQMALDGEVPAHHMPQLQHQMSVLNLESIYFFSYTVSTHKAILVRKDENYIKNIIEKETEFWNYVDKKEAPPLSEKDYAYCDSTEWKELTEEWKQLNDLEERKEAIRKRLISIAGDRNAKGNGITLTKVYRKGVIPYSTIPEIKKLNLEPHRNPPSESWRLTIG
jgi:putative phage-type endonuclease